MSLRPTLLHLKPRSERPSAGIVVSAVMLPGTGTLRGSREVLIRHGGEVYRLRHTRNDKLILTK
ncbi:hemin uptake protein HemP [Lysobacter niastensis]|uniref:Hemin uptake protein HemP n=1 Tax=Lysobacter niastensis TaxID=380629 RepID=A0ABS0B213_9GAMM|nr:hemin uptake protein HemP [Lysobacter niastensis]MBF6022526.1 hemin uptake protein HemP [Lysobacter niastensis]